jgi:hypothetical protein
MAREGRTDHSQETLRQAGKTIEDLKDNPGLQDTLAHSERLHIQSKKLGGVQQQSMFPQS